MEACVDRWDGRDEHGTGESGDCGARLPPEDVVSLGCGERLQGREDGHCREDTHICYKFCIST